MCIWLAKQIRAHLGAPMQQKPKPSWKEDGPKRVFIDGTSWPAMVVTKSTLIVPAINPVKLLHARPVPPHRRGTTLPSLPRKLWCAWLRTGISVTVHGISMQLLNGSCLACTQDKGIHSTFHAQDQTCMEDHVKPCSAVSSDITAPLAETISKEGMRCTLPA